MTSRPQHLTTTNRLPGLDMLRCLAAALIFIQHSLSSCHYDDAIDVAGFRIGRIGTAIFFLLGGYLCARSSRKPAQWLKDRLVALFPAYWIITAVGFGIAAVVRNKPFDLWQVICQFAGVGYFTHGDRLINVATWFITPLLFFYGIAAVLRLVNSLWANVAVVMTFAGLALAIESGYTTALCHGATFFAAFTLSSLSNSSKRMTVVPVLLFGILCGLQPEFRYAFVASLLLIPAVQVALGTTWTTKFTSIAYEWFLVHGIIITGAARLFSSPVAVMIISVPASLLFAWLLKRTTAAIVQRVTGIKCQPAVAPTGSKTATSLLVSNADLNEARCDVGMSAINSHLNGPKSTLSKSRSPRPARV